ncbi:MAG: hypothetical protein J5854_00085 [Clostridia bacterium]|nr:hypothetical protein [Clostridia bacterium]
MVENTQLKRFEANIDVKKTVAIRPFSVTDGDTGNLLVLNVYDGQTSVDLSGCFVNMVFIHKRGISAQDSDDGSISVLGNSVTARLDPASFSPGLVECELQIYSGAANETLITSARFSFICRNAILNGDSIVSLTQFPVLTRLIGSVASAEEARLSAETARAAAEALRAAAETSRASAEAARSAAETSRAFAEADRSTAETARTAAEAFRASAETSRADAESARSSAETARVSAEALRASAETLRASAEVSRANAETLRAGAETARAAASSAAVSSANAAAASANAAAALIGEGMDGIVWKDTDESKRYLVKLRVVNGKPVMLYTEMEDNT